MKRLVVPSLVLVACNAINGASDLTVSEDCAGDACDAELQAVHASPVSIAAACGL